MIKPKPFRRMKAIKAIAVVFLFVATFTACKKDNQPAPELPIPIIDDIEIGLGNILV